MLTPTEQVTYANGRAYIHVTTDALLRQLGVLNQSAAADSTYKVLHALVDTLGAYGRQMGLVHVCVCVCVGLCVGLSLSLCVCMCLFPVLSFS